MSSRPTVSVVVPFTGSDAELEALRRRLVAIAHQPDDEVIVSDNRRHPIKTPAYARNQAAEAARGEWLVFIDADTTPAPDLLDAYFDPAPAQDVAILAGGIRDCVAPGAGVVARHAVARGQLSHSRTLNRAGTPYAQTANAAIRRSAFTEAGGFESSARAGEDADLCFRLLAAGWKLAERPAAAVSHRPRSTLGSWLAQLLIHGSGAGWLERRWPSEFGRTRRRATVRRLARHAADSVSALAQGDAERAAFSALDLIGALAFALGRLIPNRRGPRVAQTPTGNPG